jgi:hypothetical protein
MYPLITTLASHGTCWLVSDVLRGSSRAPGSGHDVTGQDIDLNFPDAHPGCGTGLQSTDVAMDGRPTEKGPSWRAGWFHCTWHTRSVSAMMAPWRSALCTKCLFGLDSSDEAFQYPNAYSDGIPSPLIKLFNILMPIWMAFLRWSSPISSDWRCSDGWLMPILSLHCFVKRIWVVILCRLPVPLEVGPCWLFAQRVLPVRANFERCKAITCEHSTSFFV